MAADTPGTIAHFLDGNRVPDPLGWEDFTSELDRDHARRLIVEKYPQRLTFTLGGWAYLFDKFTAEGWCTSVEWEARQLEGRTWHKLAAGTLILSDVVFDLNRAEADAPIADNGYGAQILNATDMEVFPTGEETRNGEALTPPTPLALEVFDPGDPLATYLANPLEAWDWKEALAHLVAFLTDNRVTVASAWYDALPDNERWAICTGRALRFRTLDNEPPRLTWAGLFTDMARLFNLWAVPDIQPDGSAVLRVEPEATWEGEGVAHSFANQEGLELSTDVERIPPSVKLGNPLAEKNEAGTAAALPFLTLRGFSPEDIPLRGVCNGPDALDLTTKAATCTNAIERAVLSITDELDKALVLVQYDQSTSQATKGDYLDTAGAGPFLYNEQAQNIEVLRRYRLPADGVVAYGSTAAGFLAECTFLGTTITSPAFGPTGGGTSQQRFDNDYIAPGEDPDNNYGNGTTQGNPVSEANSRYTVPAQGYYIFQARIPWQIVANGHSTESVVKTVRAIVAVKRWAAGGTLLQTVTADAEQTAVGNYLLKVTAPMPCQVGEYVTVETGFGFTPPPFGPILGTYTTAARVVDGGLFFTSFVATGGGELPASNSDQFPGLLLKFTRPLHRAAWLSLTKDPSPLIAVSTDADRFRFGHVLNAQRNAATGSVEWILQANRSQLAPQ